MVVWKLRVRERASLLNLKFKAAYAAFRYSRYPVRYAIIYDSLEGVPEGHDRREEYYEVFSSPKEAVAVFKTAFPLYLMNKNGELIVENPRLVLILGDLETYDQSPFGDTND